jgi:nucleotidyltransferase AbiEii toxin of type IV toxin-antitoxin system
VNPIYAAASEIQAFCAGRGWPFCFIGGIAVQRWGEPRLTVDVDLTLLTGFGREAAFADTLLGHFPGRIPDAREFSLRNRVLLLFGGEHVPLDVSFGAMPFEERTVARSSDFPIGAGSSLRTCSAEDLLVHKVFAGRDKDWADVAGIVARQAGRLDADLVFRELEPLLELKGSPDSGARLRIILLAKSEG